MKIRNVSGDDRTVPGLGGRLVLAGAVVDVEEDQVWSYTCQEPNWAPGDDEAQKVHDREAKAHAVEDDTAPVLPGKNASREAWADYAVDAGLATVSDVEGKSRDELISLYGPQEG